MRVSDPVRLTSLSARRAELAAPERQLARLAQLPLAREFDDALAGAGLSPLAPRSLDVLQINVGKLCNQVCRHCHVDAGPDRREVMNRETMQLCLDVVEEHAIGTVDITGGAPELNPDFRWLVAEARARGAKVMDRCNLTVLETAQHADLPAFFAAHQVEVICSLPHYRALSTDRQRGEGVFERSIRALKRLGEAGYGRDPALRLVIVTNPVGAFLPASQASLESEWKREMARLYDVSFDALYCITNMPISRYLEWLEHSGNLERYMEQLVGAFNPQAASGVMCRDMISVSWDGRLYDCDFNQMLELEIESVGHIRDFDAEALLARHIRVARHCFGCTAGAGSSCGGNTA